MQWQLCRHTPKPEGQKGASQSDIPDVSPNVWTLKQNKMIYQSQMYIGQHSPYFGFAYNWHICDDYGLSFRLESMKAPLDLLLLGAYF